MPSIMKKKRNNGQSLAGNEQHRGMLNLALVSLE